jgi:hypothetical protein
MVWKQDLAKLKAQLREEPAPPPVKVAPKPVEAAPRSIEEEDALFLAMMGRRAPAAATPSAPHPGKPAVPAPTPTPAAAAPSDFGEALAGLKGMKRLETDPVLAAALAPAPPPPIAAPAPEVLPPAVLESAPLEPPLAPSEPPAPEGARSGVPQRIQLAAGMAIEVDGSLDLRGHSVQDALERIKDRVADAQFLRWRSLLIQLGPGAALHEGFLAMVAAGGVPGVARFAQAPIPMGGTQAWVLYLLP